MSFLALSSEDANMPNADQLRQLNLALAQKIYADDMQFIHQGRATQDQHPIVIAVGWELLAESDQARYLNLAASALMFMRERVRSEMERGNLDVRVERK